MVLMDCMLPTNPGPHRHKLDPVLHQSFERDFILRSLSPYDLSLIGSHHWFVGWLIWV